ncbi:chaperone protein dnaJ [Striga asiatica]|uniref:Chaperone protein dnaJ n=1 Tax=Striga asiatica TaxID=4170 RepID=A0A5A7PYT2_STRAF|nr:chaperone protein dnaJ [Striga asiatica]
MDHYKELGVQKNASKEEIKHAFRNLAMKFHPDKHSQSPEHLRRSATLRFKQLSEAYETLIDDRKRAEYNLGRNAYGASRSQNYGHSSGSGGYSYSNPYGYGYGHSGGSARRSGGGHGGVFTKLEMGLRYLTTRSFLLNATFFSVLLGGMYIIDASGKALWEMHNYGKSFEEAIDSVEKAKTRKDGSY